MALLIEAVIPYVSGLPQDVSVNNFAFDLPASGTDMAVLTGKIATFYNSVPSGTSYSIGQLMGQQLIRGAGTSKFKVYDITGHLDGTPHGSPISESTWGLANEHASGEPSLPEEVAITASFYGSLAGLSEEAGGTRPKARHRGRIYLGPVNSLTNDYDSTTKRRQVHVAAIATVRGAMLALAAAEATWSVWSRRNAALYHVTGGFVDNAFDTQRRRGTKATSRSTWGTAA